MSSRHKTLTYSRALLELTVRENGEAMATITRVFAEFAGLFQDIEQRLQEAGARDGRLGSVAADCAGAGEVLREGLRAVQMHDITDQRLSHIAELLGALSEGRECEISSVLTEEEERALLSLIERGVPGHEVFGHLGGGDEVRGSVELF